ncbi:MAG: hypothetical protein GXP47_06415 [Acidobacteria bacterium]|nr:hypothetical protein [Acidobacteriota bacterium]
MKMTGEPAARPHGGARRRREPVPFHPRLLSLLGLNVTLASPFKEPPSWEGAGFRRLTRAGQVLAWCKLLPGGRAVEVAKGTTIM